MKKQPVSENLAYVPGLCNINHKEIALRRKAGFAGLGVFVVVLVVLLLLSASPWWRLLLITPAFVSAIGFLQAKNKFCVMYAASYQQNATEGSTSAKDVKDEESRKADARRARQINLQAFGIVIVVMVAVFLLPR